MRSSPRQGRAQGCLPCDQVAADAALDRIEVWWDATRRLTMALRPEVLGCSCVEPQRHLPYDERELRDPAIRVSGRRRGASTGR